MQKWNTKENTCFDDQNHDWLSWGVVNKPEELLVLWRRHFLVWLFSVALIKISSTVFGKEKDIWETTLKWLAMQAPLCILRIYKILG